MKNVPPQGASDPLMQSRLALIERARSSTDLLEALTQPDLNLAGLLPCDAAAVTLAGQARCLGDELTEAALALSAELGHTAAPQLFYTNAWRGNATLSAARYRGVLGVRFHGAAGGWLFWFRRSDSVAGSAPLWDQADFSAARELQVGLMEQCLDQASTAIRQQRHWINALCHDLSNPLQSVLMSASMLREDGRRNLDLRRNLLLAGRKLQRLLDDNKLLAHCRSGELPNMVAARCDLSQLCHQHAAQAGGAVEPHIRPGVMIEVDAQRFGRLLDILLSLTESRDGAAHPVEMSLDCQGDECVLTFDYHDNLLKGEDAAAISQATANGTALPLDSGSGLDLASAIALAHGGSLTAEQDDSHLRLCCRVPLAEQPAER